MPAATTSATACITAEIANPIIQATIETFDIMLGAPVKRESLGLYNENEDLGAITAVIGLSGVATGSVCVSFSEKVAFEAVRRMVDLKVDRINSLVCDAVGEFANVIVGNAKNRLEQLDLEMGLPNIVHGKSYHVQFPTQSHPICVSFQSGIGPFKIGFGFVQR